MASSVAKQHHDMVRGFLLRDEVSDLLTAWQDSKPKPKRNKASKADKSKADSEAAKPEFFVRQATKDERGAGPRP
jgi:hypothetical protein